MYWTDSQGVWLQTAQSGSRPIYSEDDVAEHATKDTGVWVTYQGGVYDVTNWVCSLQPAYDHDQQLLCDQACDASKNRRCIYIVVLLEPPVYQHAYQEHYRGCFCGSGIAHHVKCCCLLLISWLVASGFNEVLHISAVIVSQSGHLMLAAACL